MNCTSDNRLLETYFCPECREELSMWLSNGDGPSWVCPNQSCAFSTTDPDGFALTPRARERRSVGAMVADAALDLAALTPGDLRAAFVHLQNDRDRLRGRIWKAARAIVLGDRDEAYHQLYLAVDPAFDVADRSPFDDWTSYAEDLP